jgi:adenylate cyclase class 2
MQTEIEVKFLNIDHDVIRAELKSAGAKLENPMRMMRRVVFDLPHHVHNPARDGWARLRDEGDKVTLTYKTSQENKFGGATEIEVTVSDYEKTIKIFKAVGLVITTNQETRRETWMLNDAEVVLDEWPWLNPLVEIEAPSEEAVRAAAKKLNFDWNNAVFGSVTTAYRHQYPAITNDDHISAIPEIKFNLPVPEWFRLGKK